MSSPGVGCHLVVGLTLSQWDLHPRQGEEDGGLTRFSCLCLCTGCMLAQRWTSGAAALSSMPFSAALCLSMMNMSLPSSRRSGEVCFTSPNTSTAPLPLFSCTCCRLTPSSEQPSRTSGQPRWDGVGWLCLRGSGVLVTEDGGCPGGHLLTGGLQE